MTQKKDRVIIPVKVSARVLFESDRTCCVCRQKKPVQIHHIDENPANNNTGNLAVLCLDCHRDTQIRGGFDRKLDAEQVKLYRNDWLERVRKSRIAETPDRSNATEDADADIRIYTAQLEIAKANEEWYEVARIYDDIGDDELRDKYIDLAGAQNPGPFHEFLFARLQGRVNELPRELIDAAMDEAAEDLPTHAVILVEAGCILEAAGVYLKVIQQSLDEGNFFSAAFFMRHGLDDNIVDELFEMSLEESRQKNDLWWQIRALEELNEDDAKRELLLGNERKILSSGDLQLIRELASAKKDAELLLKTEKEISTAGIAGLVRYEVDEEE